VGLSVGLPEGTRAESLESFGRTTPVGRAGRPEEVASAIAFVIGNAYVNRIVLTVDGGGRLAS
jgi:NAD(P)-dependent dehydrogenase (short-subunit alcohol dehydrogenase family)